MSSPENPDAAGPRVLGGRYEIHRTLARGGMAEVYLARDRSLDRPVAVKVLFSEFAADPAFVERFRREAQAAAGLAHPNIVAVYDWGSEGSTYYIVMEYVDGQSLADVLRSSGPLHPRRAAEVAFEVAGALGFAHSRGVVHRDVKPGNVLISSSGVSKVTDFGIARAMSSPSEDLTQAGSVMGTATYFSPEQAQGFSVDARSDLYSLGVVLYEILCGRPPFNGDSPVAIAYKHVQEAPALPSTLIGGMPPGLEAVVMRLLAKNPDNRYRSADDLRADLRRWLDGQPTLAEQTPAPAMVTDPTRVATPAVVAVPEPLEPDDEIIDEEEEEKSRTGVFFAIFAVLVAVLAGLSFWLWKSLRDDSSTAQQIEVPRVVNLPVAEARTALDRAGFAVDEQREANDTVPVDTVFDQSPAAGQKLEKGKTVVITVSTGSAQIEIPNVAGRPRDEALKLLDDRGFNNITQVEADSDVVDAGSAVGTEPAFGQTAAAGAEIRLIISRGRNSTPVPNVAGKSLDSAKAAITAAGFKVGNVVPQNSDTVPKDRVIGTDPDGAAPKNSAINIIQSTGTGRIAVPSVIGQLEAAATTSIEGAGLQVQVVTKALPSGDSNVGRVISTDPAAGAEVAPGFTVKVTVGVATATTTAPPATTTTTTAAPPPGP